MKMNKAPNKDGIVINSLELLRKITLFCAYATGKNPLGETMQLLF